MSTRLEDRPGVVAVHVKPCGEREAVAECADCGCVKVIRRRGLCGGVTKRTAWRYEAALRELGEAS